MTGDADKVDKPSDVAEAADQQGASDPPDEASLSDSPSKDADVGSVGELIRKHFGIGC